MQVYETGRRKEEGEGEGIGDEIIKKNKLAQYKVGGGNCDDKNKSDFQKWRRGTRL
jgi:hypothetical protein